MNFSKQKNSNLVIKGIENTEKVLIGNIVYLEFGVSYITYYMINYEKVPYSIKSLEFYKRELENAGFLKINDKYMINLRHLKHLKNKPKRCVVLHDNVEFIVSRKRWWLFQEYVKKL